MATWTAPETWAVNQTVHASDLNQMRDDLNWLYGPDQARIFRNSTQSITADTWTKVSFNTARWNGGGMWSSGTPAQLTIQTSGKYLVGAHLVMDAFTGTGYYHAYGAIRVGSTNGVDGALVALTQNTDADPNGGGPGRNNLSVPLNPIGFNQFVAGDVLTVWVRHHMQITGAALNLLTASGANADTPEFWAVWRDF